RPQEGDQFVFSSGDRDGQLVTPEYLPLGGPQQLAYPMDPRAKIVRNGSTLNLVALIRFDPAELADETRALAADGVVAYSAICTHQRCGGAGRRARAACGRGACRGAADGPRDGARGVVGAGAGAEEGLRLGLPHRDWASLVRAERRVRHHAVRRKRP